MTLILPTTGQETGGGSSQLAGFRARLEQIAGHDLHDVRALHRWTVEHSPDFWRELLLWSGLPWSGSAEVARVGDDVETARFFPDLRLNYAEALLQPVPDVDDDAPALTSVHAGRPAETWTRAELRAEVRRAAAVLDAVGLRTGERIVLVAPNTGRTAVVALAAAALGAPLATAMPDMGATALLGRMEQVEPVLLAVDRTTMTDGTFGELVAGLPTLRRVLVLDDGPLPTAAVPVDRLEEVVVEDPDGPAWERHPFDAPLFVMFSSGTTGPPKAMVHGLGGTLLEHVKEHRLHGDLGPSDTLYFHTTTAWMMWNWQLSALASGAHVVLHDGTLEGPETLWELVAEHGVTVFGTSPAYLQLCQETGYLPLQLPLSRLRAVLSTGAVLHDWQFDWLAEAVGPVPLQSISGGTDIIGCFVLGIPEAPVPRGRVQARSLGLDVAAVDGEGAELVGGVGELVCRNPFPSRPVGFLRDPDGRRFHEAYFAANPGWWTHGDLVDFDEQGTARLHGRSDGVLNIDGVRIGPSEIYAVLRRFPEIADSLAVEQRDPRRPGALRMVLLLVLRGGAAASDDLSRRIRRALREQASAAHVPSVIAVVPDLPTTHNGKKSERAARDAVNGDPVANLPSLRNPGCLEAIAAAVRSERTGGAAPAVEASGDALLRDVTAVWCDVLQVDDAAPDDDFSDVGGTSRLAMVLVRRIALDLGVDVRVQDLLAAPTPRGLADAVARRTSTGTDAAPLMRTGHGRPLFVLADAWGHVDAFAALVDRLGTERPVHGLRPRLVADDGTRLEIPEVARHAVELLREVQARGPYSLTGYSFGGLVAYEMAVQLAAAGEQVSYLGLVDTVPPEAAMTPGEIRAAWWAHRVHLVQRELRPTLRAWLRIDRPDEPSSADRFFAESSRIAEAYRPGPFDGAVTYYLAEDRSPVVGNTLAAWRRVAPHLLVTEVPGKHSEDFGDRPGILALQFADVLAARMTAALR